MYMKTIQMELENQETYGNGNNNDAGKQVESVMLCTNVWYPEILRPKGFNLVYENRQLKHLTCTSGYPVNLAIFICQYIEQAIRASLNISYPSKTLSQD